MIAIGSSTSILADAAATDTLLTERFRDIEKRRPISVCLLNNAATVEAIGVLGRLSSGEISSAIATNLSAAVTLANLFCRVFTDSKVSRTVINISSGAAEEALSGHAVYSVAKAALRCSRSHWLSSTERRPSGQSPYGRA